MRIAIIKPVNKYLTFVIPAKDGNQRDYWMPDFNYLVAGLINSP